MGPGRWTNAPAVLAAVLWVTFFVLGVTRVSTPEGECGTGFSPGWADTMPIGRACEEAMSDRRWLMMATGLASAAAAGVVVARSRRDPRRASD